MLLLVEGHQLKTLLSNDQTPLMVNLVTNLASLLAKFYVKQDNV